MQHLFKTFTRSPAFSQQALRFQQLGMASQPAMRIFSSLGSQTAANTGLGDVGEIFKANYTVEFDQGLTAEEK